MICCGYERLTPFCSQCGKAMNLNSIYGLLDHVKRYRDFSKQDYEKRKDIHGNTPYVKKVYTRYKKWDDWCRGLEKLIKKDKP